jgi:hypothetical protein
VIEITKRDVQTISISGHLTIPNRTDFATRLVNPETTQIVLNEQTANTDLAQDGTSAR